MTAATRWWRDHLAQLPCILCSREWVGGGGPVQLHHVARGSGKRHDYGLAVLCDGHHQGAGGLHGLGAKAFIRLYRPPGDDEFGLIIWTLEDLAKALYAQYGRGSRGL